ncbi:hypothetical protein Bxe_C0812 [Paraburkholderia xenovorans LB400]|uniref:Uncharacterized protein n=1 Tax=Paraburkholderia xenovorans (strain LB400) TaxID=266265 RepID=Q13GU5_PARXL|nr:hypothetical protein Bxe_C0812 [Paraburkholderia xenovorans LB400]
MDGTAAVSGQRDGEPGPGAAAKALHTVASAQGTHEFAARWEGQGAPLPRILPATDLTERLVRKWQEESSR